ncbi:MAG TPA: ABC transporter permease [Firmicutes bacterium]|nr:ABC transporter permease [Bacillota bacterium]
MLEAISEAVSLLLHLDRNLLEIILLTLFVSGSAVILAALFGVPCGTWLGMQPAKRVRWLTRIIYTLMGLPPVVGGLLVYMLIRRNGPLGSLGLLFTPPAMIMAQFLLATPIVIGLTSVSVRSKGREILATLISLGADRGLVLRTIIREARFGILAALITGFGRVVAEVGAVTMVGGNIEGFTRVMTTAIVLEVRQGKFATGLALGIILLLLSFIINILLYRLQWGGSDE